MQIYISRNGQQFGPYSEGEINRQISTGVISHSDLAWHEGLPEWRQLGTIFGASSVPPPAPRFPPPPPPQVEYHGAAKYHISSFGPSPWSPGQMTTLVICSIIIPMIGLVFGIIGLCNQDKRNQGGILLAITAAVIVFWAAIAHADTPPPPLRNQVMFLPTPPPRDEYEPTGWQPY